MEAQTLSHADYLDILFNNRNKKYGGYELRRHYGRRMKNAAFLVFGLAGILSAYSLLTDKQVAELPIIPPTEVPVRPTLPPIFETPSLKPVTAETPSAKPTIEHTVPIIVKNDDVVKPPKTQEELDGKEPGSTDSKGDPGGAVTTIPGGDGIKITEPVVSAPVFIADQMPEFIDNLSQYLGKHLLYPARAREAGIEGKVTVRFVVNEDGTVSDVKVVRGIGGGCDEEAMRVVSGMPKWKPGMQNGRAVKVYYNLPVRFVLQ